MDSLIKKMLGELPYPDDEQQKKEEKAKQIALDKDSYLLHEAKCSEIFGSFETNLKRLDKKMQSVGAATGDWAGANTIRSSLAEQLDLVGRSKTQLNQRRQVIDLYLSDPNKIPQALQSPSQPSSD